MTRPIQSLYLIGSLRNLYLPNIAETFRKTGIEVFDDWYAAGPHADDAWKAYETRRGRTYEDALRGYAAGHVFRFDLKHLQRCDAAVLVLPAGKSAHLELGWVLGQGKPGWVLLEPAMPRWDVMYQFATGVYSRLDELVDAIQEARVRAAA